MDEKERRRKWRRKRGKTKSEKKRRKGERRNRRESSSSKASTKKEACWEIMSVQRRVELMIRQVVKSIPIFAAHALFTMTKMKLVLIGSLALVADGYMKTVWLM